MGVIQSNDYADRERALASDPVVQRMAADLRYSGAPREDYAHEDGTARHEFMGAANDAYRSMGGDYEGPLHLGAVPNAVLKLAFDSTPATYSVYPGGSGSPVPYSPEYDIEAINTQELGLRIRALIADATQVREQDIRVEIMGSGADHMCAGRADGPQGELMAFQFQQR